MSNNSNGPGGRIGVKYCVDCGWFARDDREEESNGSRAAIEHFLETGHTIESVGTAPPPSLVTRR